jgi:L-ribulokinase
VYQPSSAAADRYERLFVEYTGLHDHFGRGGTDVMRRLKQLRREALM